MRPRLRPAMPVRARGRRRPRARARGRSTAFPASTTSPATESSRSRRRSGLLGKRIAPVLPAVGGRSGRRPAALAWACGSPTRCSTSSASAAASTTAATRRAASSTATRLAETVQAFAKHLRLHPILRGIEQSLHLRGRGRAIPAPEPADPAPRALSRGAIRDRAGAVRHLSRLGARGGHGPRNRDCTYSLRTSRAWRPAYTSQREVGRTFAFRSDPESPGRRSSTDGAESTDLDRADRLPAIVGVLLAYWWDSTHKDTIAEGVTIGGVDVGGLESDAAASQVRTNLVAPLEKTLTVTYGDETFELTDKEADVHTDIDAMVDEALEVSQEGGLPSASGAGSPARRSITRSPRRSPTTRTRSTTSSTTSSTNIDQAPVDASIDPSGGVAAAGRRRSSGSRSTTAKLRDAHREGALRPGLAKDRGRRSRRSSPR